MAKAEKAAKQTVPGAAPRRYADAAKAATARRRSRNKWDPDDCAAVIAFASGETAELKISHSDRACKRKFPDHFRALRELRGLRAPCHEATLELYSQLKSGRMTKEGGAMGELERALDKIFCTSPVLARGDVAAAQARAKAWRHLTPKQRKSLDV